MGCAVGIDGRIGGEQAVDDAEQHQQRGLQQVRHHGGQVVVVAETDLGHADGVVLVDDRQTAPLEQGDDGVADIEVARAAVEVAGGEQELRRGDAVAGEAVFPGAHEEGLADGGAGLQLPQVGGAFAQAEPADAGADGPGTDQGDLPAGGAEAVDLVGQGLHLRRFERAVGAGQHVGADLHDHGVRQGDDFLPDGVEHGGEVLGSRRVSPSS